jgi:PAS domain-containing protein
VGPSRLPVQVESMTEPAFILDLDGLVITWNKAAEKFFGKARDVAVGQRCPALILGKRPNGEAICRLYCPWIQGFALIPARPATEMLMRSAVPGERQLATLVSVPLSDPSGAPIALLHVVLPEETTAEAKISAVVNGSYSVRVLTEPAA